MHIDPASAVAAPKCDLARKSAYQICAPPSGQAPVVRHKFSSAMSRRKCRCSQLQVRVAVIGVKVELAFAGRLGEAFIGFADSGE
jgi:hypothetical protein